MNFSNMSVQISFLTCCVLAIITSKWFFACVNSNMSDQEDIFFKSFSANGTNMAKFGKLQNKYLMDQNLFNLNLFKSFIVNSSNMPVQMSFLICCVLAITTTKWFLACMYSDMPGKVTF